MRKRKRQAHQHRARRPSGRAPTISRGAAAQAAARRAGPGPGAGAASAAGPPLLGASLGLAVLATRLASRRNRPQRLATAYHFDYITDAAYEANLAPAKTASPAPSVPPAPTSASAPATSTDRGHPAAHRPARLDTAYRYRVVAQNIGRHRTDRPARVFTTQPLAGGSLLPDGRGWELVSPGRQERRRDRPRRERSPAAASCRPRPTAARSPTAPPPPSARARQGAPPASQYISDPRRRRLVDRRTSPCRSSPAPTAPSPDGVPYQLFSDRPRARPAAQRRPLPRRRQRLPGRQPAAGRHRRPGRLPELLPARSGARLRGAARRRRRRPASRVGPAHFDLAFAGASPDLGHVVLSTCAALTADATEVPLGEGCDPSKPNLYEWTGGAASASSTCCPATPGAGRLAAQAGAVSADGSRVYWATERRQPLPARRRRPTKQVDAPPGEGGPSRPPPPTARSPSSPRPAHLWRYDAADRAPPPTSPRRRRASACSAPPPTARTVYYHDRRRALPLARRHDRRRRRRAPSRRRRQLPAGHRHRPGQRRRHQARSSSPTRSADRLRQHRPRTRAKPDSEVYLYDAGAEQLTCVSCNPTGSARSAPRRSPARSPTAAAEARPAPTSRASSPPTAAASSSTPATPCVAADTNTAEPAPDVYEWEAQGEGSCAKAGGCVGLISSGRAAGGATFVEPPPTAPTSSSSPTPRWSAPTPARSTSTTPGSAAASRTRRRRSPATATPARPAQRTGRPGPRPWSPAPATRRSLRQQHRKERKPARPRPGKGKCGKKAQEEGQAMRRALTTIAALRRCSARPGRRAHAGPSRRPTSRASRRCQGTSIPRACDHLRFEYIDGRLHRRLRGAATPSSAGQASARPARAAISGLSRHHLPLRLSPPTPRARRAEPPSPPRGLRLPARREGFAPAIADGGDPALAGSHPYQLNLDLGLNTAANSRTSPASASPTATCATSASSCRRA